LNCNSPFTFFYTQKNFQKFLTIFSKRARILPAYFYKGRSIMSTNFQRLDKLVGFFPSNNILCVGDMMLDEYISGPADRLSPEAPVPVIRRKDVRQVLGGVGNVAANLAALGCQTSVYYAVAQDHEADQIKQMLAAKNITAYPFTAGLMTTKKQRIMAYKQQICRIDSEEPLKLSKQQEDMIIHQISSLLPHANLVLLSDYNKGLITPRVAQGIIQAATEQHKPVLVDPKGNDYTKYAGATLIKPNLNELKTAVKQLVPQDTDVDTLNLTTPNGIEKVQEFATLLREKLGIEQAVVTLGEYGMLASDTHGTIYRPTTAKAVSDVSGAGDTSLALLGASFVSGTPLENSLDLANIGAGIVVGKQGTATLSAGELRTTLRNMFNAEPTTLWSKTFGARR
jgi:D-beta-D-heptose 7-phosphate kinase/D-beta-D-heptose 1-phosphate adenosyltransferase